MNALIIAIIIFVGFWITPIIFHFLYIKLIPDKFAYANSLFSAYGSIHTVNIIHSRAEYGILGRGRRKFEFILLITYHGKDFTYEIRTNDSYAKKYIGQKTCDMYILTDYYDWKLGIIDYELLIRKYSNNKIKFSIHDDYDFPKMIFPERLEIYNQKNEKLIT